MQNLRILLILLVLLSCSNEEEKRDISSVSRGENNEDLSLLSEDFQEKIYSPLPNLHVAVGYGLANSILVVGDGESLIIDTMGGIETANRVIKDMGDLNPNKEIKIAYTHFHADHTLGAGAFEENFQINGVIGHRDLETEFENFMGIKRTLIGERSQKMFGLILKDKNFSDGIGIKLEAGVDTSGYLKPDIVFDKTHSEEVGGLIVDFIHAPGETDDQIFVWIEEMKTLFSGDNIYKAFPNIYTIRGTSFRSFRSWYQSIEKMIALEPEVLVPSHGVPIIGKENILEILKNYRDAIKYVHDQTMRKLNLGGNPIDVAQSIKLPKSLRENPYLFELYGSVEWSSRNLFNGYFGWFDGNPSNLHPLEKKEFSSRLRGLISDEKLLEEIKGSFEKKDYQWTLFLTDLFSEENIEVRNLRAETLRILGEEAYNPNAKSYYLSEYAAISDIETSKGFVTAESSITDKMLRELSILMFLDIMAIRLDPKDTEELSETVKIKFNDLNEIWELRLHNSVLTYKVVETLDDIDIEMESLTFKKLLTQKLNPVVDILLSSNLATGENKAGFLGFVARFRN